MIQFKLINHVSFPSTISIPLSVAYTIYQRFDRWLHEYLSALSSELVISVKREKNEENRWRAIIAERNRGRQVLMTAKIHGQRVNLIIWIGVHAQIWRWRSHCVHRFPIFQRTLIAPFCNLTGFETGSRFKSSTQNRIFLRQPFLELREF